MHIRLSAVIAILLVAAVSGDGYAPPLSSEARASYAKACTTYENRARFLQREERRSFIGVMADGCLAAQQSLDAKSGGERMSAVAYLDRLVTFRDTVISINMDRLYGANASPFARPVSGTGTLRPLGEVSEAGEFLIAHRMGLLDAFDTWRAQAPAEAFAQGGAPVR
ncbi:MAG: hypothetical protein AAF183_23595 [Pseudomonadota bacterium]